MVERQLPKLHTRVRFPSPAHCYNSVNMNTAILRGLSSGAVAVLILAAVSCGSVESDRTSRLVAPQTGSLIGRRVPVKTAPVTDAKSKKPATKREKTKRERPPAPAEDDHMTRGGFR